MSDDSNDDDGQGRTGALSALREVSAEPDIVSDYKTIAGAFSDADYQIIIDLAWRHQFNKERLNFKREMRELQQHVCQKVLKSIEETE